MLFFGQPKNPIEQTVRRLEFEAVAQGRKVAYELIGPEMLRGVMIEDITEADGSLGNDRKVLQLIGDAADHQVQVFPVDPEELVLFADSMTRLAPL